MHRWLGVFAALALPLTAADTVPLPPTLKPEGIPAIQQSFYDQMSRYAEYRSAHNLGWRAGERELLITTRFSDVPQLHLVAAPGADRRQLTFFPDAVTWGRFNPIKSDELIFSKDVGGGEFFQYYLLNLRTGDISLITKGGKTRNTGLAWSRDGHRVAWASTARDGEHADIWIADPHRPENSGILLQSNEHSWQVTDWSPDSSEILAVTERSAVSADVHLIDTATRQDLKIGPDDPANGYLEARFANDRKGAYVVSNVGSDFTQLGYVDFASRRFSPRSQAIHWDVSDVDVTGDGQYVAFLANEDGIARIHVINAKAGSETKLPAVEQGVTSGLHWRDGSHELAWSTSNAKSPGDSYSVDVDTGKVERWTQSETGGLNASSFAEAKLIHWKSFDGLELSGFLYPAAARFKGPRPVIIDIHGGPEGQSLPDYLGQFNAYTNELGITVIFPNVRGSSGYGKRFINLDNGPKREDTVKDIGALLDWIRTQPELDAARIMVTGGSYGGYMTLATMTHYSDRVRCAIEIVGISNFRTFLEHTEAYRRDLRRVEYGDERDPKMRDLFETISPLNNAAKITKPMFIVAGFNDPRVPYTEGKQMSEALRKNNIPVWYLLAEDEGHGFRKKRNRDYLAAASMQFVKTYLLNE